MKIIARKTNLYNMNDFLAQNKNRDYVDGLFINVAGTSDNKIIIFDVVNNNYQDLNNVEQQTLDNIYQVSIVSLSQFLDQVINQKVSKKIYINILLNFNIFDFTRIQNYLTAILNIIRNYPTLNFYLCSENQNIVSNLKRFDTNDPIGLIVGPGSYLDVDFYIFSVLFLNPTILAEQHFKGKDLLILLNNWSDLQSVQNFFNSTNNQALLTEELKDQLRIIGEYPEIIHRTLN